MIKNANGKGLTILLILFCLSGCRWNSNTARQTPWGELHSRVGGIVLPAATPAQPAGSHAPLTTPTISLLQVGQTVIATGNADLWLHADASMHAPVMEVYAAGELFTVVEPSGTYTTYPVQNGERTWIRLQATDGLVGWALIDGIMAPD
jgi:hypothetical protein